MRFNKGVRSAFSIDGNSVLAAATIFRKTVFRFAPHLARFNLAFLRQPAFLADQRHKPHIGDVFGLVFCLRKPRDTDKFLDALVLANRDYQPAANSKLLLQGLGHHRPARCHDNCIIGRIFRPALRTIAMANKDIVIVQIGKEGGGLFGELGNAFNRIDMSGDARKNGSCVTGARANLKDGFSALEIKRLDHESYDIGLRDRLVGFNWKRRVIIGEFPKRLGQECLAGNHAHGLQHTGSPNTAREELPLYHLVARFRGCNIIHGVKHSDA